MDALELVGQIMIGKMDGSGVCFYGDVAANHQVAVAVVFERRIEDNITPGIA